MGNKVEYAGPPRWRQVTLDVETRAASDQMRVGVYAIQQEVRMILDQALVLAERVDPQTVVSVCRPLLADVRVQLLPMDELVDRLEQGGVHLSARNSLLTGNPALRVHTSRDFQRHESDHNAGRMALTYNQDGGRLTGTICETVDLERLGQLLTGSVSGFTGKWTVDGISQTLDRRQLITS